MTFLWPEYLPLLLIVPAAMIAYVALQRRKKKFALRYASLALIKEALRSGQTIRRHTPPVLFLLALTSLLMAAARPAALLTLPFKHDSVILAIDTSISMLADDVSPNRLAAAQAAARTFVADQPRNTRIGLVSFAATASVVQPPTTNRDEILGAIDRLQLQGGTAVGSGILVSLKTIFPDIEFDLESSNPRGNAGKQAKGKSLDKPSQPVKPQSRPVPPGSYESAVIILLSDGRTTLGPDPIEAARMAAERGVRIFTVGIGTANGQILGAGDWAIPVLLDEPSMKQIASLTKAEYFYAGNAMDLKKIYKMLQSRLVLEKKQTEVTAFFAAAAAILMLFSGLLSMMWFNRRV